MLIKMLCCKIGTFSDYHESPKQREGFKVEHAFNRVLQEGAL